VLALLLVFAGAVRADEHEDEGMEGGALEGQRMMEAFLTAAGAFTKDTRLTEADIQKFIALYDSFDQIDEDDDEDLLERAYRDGKVDLNVILQDENYVRWAREHDVDPKSWLQVSMRLMLFMSRAEALEQMKDGEEQIKEQLAEIESMREQVGEEMYEQMKQALEQGVAMMKRMLALFESLPKPTEEEQKLLDKYKEALAKLGEGDEDEEDDWDDEG
jgi:uncharacterized phage infection (PIP) family protein YhgE